MTGSFYGGFYYINGIYYNSFIFCYFNYSWAWPCICWAGTPSPCIYWAGISSPCFYWAGICCTGIPKLYICGACYDWAGIPWASIGCAGIPWAGIYWIGKSREGAGLELWLTNSSPFINILLLKFAACIRLELLSYFYSLPYCIGTYSIDCGGFLLIMASPLSIYDKVGLRLSGGFILLLIGGINSDFSDI